MFDKTHTSGRLRCRSPRFDKFCENLRIEDHVRKRHF